MLKKIALLLAVSAIFSVLSVRSQEEKTQEERSPKQETRVERPVENPRPEPKQEPRPERPRESTRPVETPRSEPRQSSPRERPSDNEERRRPNPRQKDTDIESPRPRKPRDNDGNPERPNKPERPPVNNPNTPVVNPNPPTVNNQSKDKDKDKDRDRDDRRRNRNGSWGGYYPTSSPTVISSPLPRFSMREYFDKDDVFFDAYNSFIDKPENYLPFFEDSPSLAFQPLYYAYGRKFFNNEFPWVSDDWTVYYEPDLDDIFVDFTKLGNIKYERMVLYPIGKTIKDVNKKFEYKGSEIRPVLVEKIPDLEQDKVYSFNVHDLPKGDYELRFVAKDGATVKHSIRIK